MTYVPGEGPCYRCVFKNPPPKDAVPTCKQAGVIGAMGGVIGSLQAMEAIKYIIGQGELLTGYLLTYDALKMEFRKVNFRVTHTIVQSAVTIRQSQSLSTTNRQNVTVFIYDKTYKK